MLFRSPTFANFDASIPNANATGHFTCSSVVNVLTKTVIEMDQSYYGYYACACDAGYYGEYNQCYECPASNAICSNGKINSLPAPTGRPGASVLIVLIMQNAMVRQFRALKAIGRLLTRAEKTEQSHRNAKQIRVRTARKVQ